MLGKTIEELEVLAEEHGQPKYRGKQMHQALFMGKKTVEEIHNVS